MQLANQGELNKTFFKKGNGLLRVPIDGASLTDQERADLGLPDDLSREEFIPEFIGPCFNCGEIVTNFVWCYGCDSFICEKCMVNDETDGKHNRIVHLDKVET